MNALQRLLSIFLSYTSLKQKRRFKSRDALLKWQDRQVQNFLKKILPKSKFYQNHIQGMSIQDWRKFPTIDKRLMMDNFDDLNTAGISKAEAFHIAIQSEISRDFSPKVRNYTVGLSSGTTGSRGLFVVSDVEQCFWVGAVFAKALPLSFTKKHRIAFFLRANSNLYENVKSRSIDFRYFDLLGTMENHIRHLNDYKPTVLVCQPSVLRLLAEAQSAGKLNISPVKIISVAEVLDPVDEVYIRKHFNQVVHQVYQCTEGFLGSSCDYGTLHLNEDMVVIQKEYIEGSSERFMPIITDFKRSTQPIIRYKLNDILVERSSPCPCGSLFTALECVEGRSDDIFYFRSQESSSLIPIFPDFIRRAILLASDTVQEYQVIQKDLDTIEVFLKVRPGTDSNIQFKVTASLLQFLNTAKCQNPQIIYHAYERPTQHAVKLRRIKRTFSVDKTNHD
jgi:putative adenylate-forming enzyme